MLRSACAVIAAGIRVSAECARFWNGQGTTGLLVRSVHLRGRQTVSSRMASESQTGTSRQTAHRQMGTYIVPYRTPGGCVDRHTVSPLVATHANRLESYRPSPHRLHQCGRSPRLPALSSSMRTPNRTPFGPLKSTWRPTSNPDIATQMTATPSRTTPSLPVLASCSSPPSYAVQVQGHQYCTWLKLVSSLSAFRRGSAGRGDTVAQTLSRKKKIARILTAALQASRSVSTSRRFARGPKHGISGASPGYGRAQPPNRSTFVLVGPSRWAARQSEGLVARWFVARHGHATSQPETHATRAQAWLFDWPQSPDRVSRNPNDRRRFLVAVARGVPGGGSTRPGCHSTPRARKTTRLRGRQIRRSLTCPGQSCGLGVPGEHANPQIPLICR